MSEKLGGTRLLFKDYKILIFLLILIYKDKVVLYSTLAYYSGGWLRVQKSYLGASMFSDFVNFRDVDLLIDNNPAKTNFGLVSLDIAHNNEYYQIYLASLAERIESLNIAGYLKQQLASNKNIFIKIKYELKKTHSQIIDLYNVIPEKNNWLSTDKNQENDIFVLNCQLMSRNNTGFDYESSKVANF